MTFLIGAIINFLSLLELLIAVDAILSWFIRPRSNEFSRMIGIVVDPVLKPCRGLQARIITNLPVDFSPVIGIILIELCKTILSIV